MATAWNELEAAESPTLEALFAAEPDRLERLVVEEAGIRFDFAKTHLSSETVDAFLRLAAESGLAERRDALREELCKPSYVCRPINLSGNTDCYQPAERKFGITREFLKIFYRYGNPVGLITKNHLILRDIDILSDLAKEGLAMVYFSITSLSEDLRRVLEPRTSSVANKLKVIEKLTRAGVPAGVVNIVTGFGEDAGAALATLASELNAAAATSAAAEKVRTLANTVRELAE